MRAPRDYPDNNGARAKWQDARGGNAIVGLQNDGVEVGTGELFSGFSAGDVVECVVAPFDGYDYGTPLVESVTISNNAPSATGVTLSPQSPTTTDDIEAVGEGWSDPDGDAEAYLYEWFVGGSIVSTDEVLLSSYTLKNQAVFVRLTPSDGISSGSPVVSNTVIVGVYRFSGIVWQSVSIITESITVGISGLG